MSSFLGQHDPTNEGNQPSSSGIDLAAAYSALLTGHLRVLKENQQMYDQILQMNGQKCYTLTSDREATMEVDPTDVTILYPSGRTLLIPREMIVEAITVLKKQGMLTVADVHEGITRRNGARTDRLLAVLRKLPGVTYDKKPRVLYFNAENNMAAP